MSRRANGEGSIYLIKTGRYKGKYGAFVPLGGYTASGNPKRRYLYGDTEKEVLIKKKALEREVEGGTYSPDRTTLNSYIVEWLKQKALEVKPRTLEFYEDTLKKHIIGRLGKFKLSALGVPQIQIALREIQAEVSSTCANRCRRVLHTVLNDAFKSLLVPRNPVSPTRKYKEEEKTETALWTDDQRDTFIKVATPHRLYAAFHLAMATGMRKGEVLGIRWSDLEGDVIRIQQTISHCKGGKRRGGPKTEKGKRRVCLDSDTLAVLEQHRNRQTLERETAGSVWTPDPDYGDLIFTSEIGTPIIPRNFDRTWKALRLKAKVPEIVFHQLRKLHGSMLHSNGFGVREIADRLGHDPKTSANTYLRTLEPRERAMAIPIQPKKTELAN